MLISNWLLVSVRKLIVNSTTWFVFCAIDFNADQMARENELCIMLEFLVVATEFYESEHD